MTTRARNPLNLLIFFLIPLLQGCEAQSNSPIKGNIHLTEGWKSKIYLVRPNHFREITADYLGQVIDSADIYPDGHFAFHDNPFFKGKSLLILVIQEVGSKYANHLMDDNPLSSNYMPLVYKPGESLEIHADERSFQTSFSLKTISKENLALLTLGDIRRNSFKAYELVTGEMHDDSLIIEKEKAFNNYIGAMMSFADSTAVVEAALLAIRWISPANDYERLPEFIYGQCQKWSASDPDDNFVKELCALAQKNKLPLMIGDQLPDFRLPLVTNDTVNLSSLIGKKLTLLDLWASWCAPCRKETREELLPLWNKYQDKGFQIIGYSIDGNEGQWKNAIQKDQSNWTQASHLIGDSTPFMDAMRISVIPANYLLDANGKIVAKNLHGQELKIFVENYLR
jgi:peroxiredoxin